MTRISKQKQRRHQSPRKRKYFLGTKTGPLKDSLKLGYREHVNALSTEESSFTFIPKMK